MPREAPSATNPDPVPAALERVRAHVLARAAVWYPDAGFEPARARLRFEPLGEPATYPLYTCAVAPAGGAETLAIVVKFTPVFGGHQEGAVEFEHLSLMHARLGSSGELRVPRPLDFLPDVNVLLTERTGGERFSRVILRDAVFGAGDASRARMQTASHRCGAWLATYHASLAATPGTAFDHEFISRLDEGLASLTGFGLPATCATRVQVTARRLAAWGKGRRVARAVQHGDFGPQNVHVSDTHICVFDPSHHVEACVFDDIDYFLVTLETLNPYPRAWRFDRARVRALRQPFLAGYFGSDAAGNVETRILVEGYYLKALVARGLKQRRNTAKRGRAALALFDRVWLAHRYARALAAQALRCDQLLAPSSHP